MILLFFCFRVKEKLTKENFICFFCSSRKALHFFCSNKFAQAARLFISFARTKETKQRKFAGCIFLPTPVIYSAKQKELASLKQLFVLNAP